MANPFETFRSPDRSGAADGNEGKEGIESQELKAGAPMTEVLDFSDRLTRLRNDRYLRTISQRMTHLSVGGSEMLSTFTRVELQERMREILPDVAAKVALRVITVLQGLKERDGIVQALMQKFPESGCSYCGHKPCICKVARPEEKTGAKSSDVQKQWTMGQWQEHLSSVYGEVNKSRGLNFIVDRLSEEIGEAGSASLQMEMQPEKAEHYREETVSELADSLAWAMAVCNEVGVSIEDKFIERYGKGCPNCGQIPCQCGPFTFVQERKVKR